jgi:hypothetical protein
MYRMITHVVNKHQYNDLMHGSYVERALKSGRVPVCNLVLHHSNNKYNVLTCTTSLNNQRLTPSGTTLIYD